MFSSRSALDSSSCAPSFYPPPDFMSLHVLTHVILHYAGFLVSTVFLDIILKISLPQNILLSLPLLPVDLLLDLLLGRSWLLVVITVTLALRR